MVNGPPCWCRNRVLSEFSPAYLRCDCGTLVDRSFPQEDLTRVTDQGEFYSRDYYLKHLPEDYGFPTLPERARGDLPERNLHWLRTLLQYKLPPARILELGSAHGGFVALAQWTGFEATGLELSPWIADFAHRTFGVGVLVGPLEKQAIAPASLDCVALLDVLEHLQDPVGTMGHALSLLKPDGILLIQTPCVPEEPRYAQMKAADHPFLAQLRPKDHLFLFSRRSASELFTRLGAAHLVFETPIFGQYDMFFVAGKTTPRKREQPEIVAALSGTPNGRLVLALLDLADREAAEQAQVASLTQALGDAEQRQRREREEVAEALRSIQSARAYRWLRRLGRWGAAEQAIQAILSAEGGRAPAPRQVSGS